MFFSGLLLFREDRGDNKGVAQGHSARNAVLLFGERAATVTADAAQKAVDIDVSRVEVAVVDNMLPLLEIVIGIVVEIE